MKHRHKGPKVGYHRNGKVRYRKRPYHKLRVIKTLPGGTKLIRVPKGMAFGDAWEQVEVKQ